jgi:topoisomerase-4 subunit B
MAADLLNLYNEDSIKSLDWREHIRLRPGMYIGKLGDGSSVDDGIYVLVKEVMDNCIDEYTMSYGKRVELTIADGGARHTAGQGCGRCNQNKYRRQVRQ